MNKIRTKRATRWNDIRIVGPALVAMLMVATIVSPSFASADNSVGVRGVRCPERIEAGPSSAVESFGTAPAGVGGFGRLLEIGCCLDGSSTEIAPIGWSSATAFSQPAPVSAGVAPRLPACVAPGGLAPLPDPIVGPTVIGPITGSSSGGMVMLSMPGLLPKYFDANRGMRVTTTVDGKKKTVYLGSVPENGKISFAGGPGDYTFHASIFTAAPYSEVISVADVS